MEDAEDFGVVSGLFEGDLAGFGVEGGSRVEGVGVVWFKVSSLLRSRPVFCFLTVT